MNLFEDMIVRTYTSRFENYSGQKLAVDGSTPSGNTDTLVSSQVLQNDGPPINLEWRVRKNPEGFRVVDVAVEGMSMRVTKRSDFGWTIRKGGGSIDALLCSMRGHSAKP